MRSWPRVFEGENLLQIAMPMGGIGAGCICLNGYGGLQDFSTRNRPVSTHVPDHFAPQDEAFAVVRMRSAKQDVTRLLEGPLPPELIYNQGNGGQGYRKGGHEGMPRFAESRFRGQYPFGTVELSDETLPVRAEITGWSPLIPLADRESGFPCAILEYRLVNSGPDPIDLEFSFHASHVAMDQDFQLSRNRAIEGRGVHLTSAQDPVDPRYGEAAIGVVGHRAQVKASWFRGGWFDSLSALWRELSETQFTENDGLANDAGYRGRNGGSVMVPAHLEPGESVTIPVVYAWYFPNGSVSTTGGGTDAETKPWRLYYSTQWASARAVLDEVTERFAELRERTAKFADALYGSDLPDEAIDAIGSNLAILKSPTILRQEDGSLWGWEGCFASSGCCAGSCTHVWNYAQAIPHLFPNLERSLREQEFRHGMNEGGHINFRLSLPMGPANHDYHAASDGQLGGILKLYREWQISGDTAWMSGLLPLAKRSLDYAISAWDPDGVGALVEPHHNTYDIEFWGPDGMCSSIYLGALCAYAEMAEATGNDATFYRNLSEKSAAFLDGELFNGEYYIQRVQWEGLRDTSFSNELTQFRAKQSRTEMEELLLAEGPKYQYGTGCLSDGVIGAWMASTYGVQTPLSQANVTEHLRSLHRYNLRKDLREHACLQRPGYAMGAEGGLILCTWPQGGKPTLPFVYSDEVWTGIEYQVAAHMIRCGLLEEGLDVVRTARARYSGRTRNPYNEYECGNYYARAMASFALLDALSGFHYSAVTRKLTVTRRLAEPYTALFCTATGYGTFRVENGQVQLNLIEGDLDIDQIEVR